MVDLLFYRKGFRTKNKMLEYFNYFLQLIHIHESHKLLLDICFNKINTEHNHNTHQPS